jgi:hypothetical protein
VATLKNTFALATSSVNFCCNSCHPNPVSVVRLLGEQTEGLDVFVLDTKNIGIGAGIQAIRAAELIETGLGSPSKRTTLYVPLKPLEMVTAKTFS